jgi:Putative Ig domain
MLKIRHSKSLGLLSALLTAGLLLAGCGGGASAPVVSAASSSVSAVPSSPGTSSAAAVTLSGSPATSVTAGQNYAFQPTVSSGGAVTFQIQGKPSWAAFNTNTGALTGTPGVANEGTSGSITITASNGSSSASIAPFTITVNAPSSALGTGSANLTWTVPTQNTDGSPVTDLAGYHIYYGTSSGAWTSTITVLDATETSYVVDGLAPGTYYFTIVAFNSSGEDSPQSNIASKTI